MDPIIGSALIGGGAGLLKGVGDFITGQKNYEVQKDLLNYQKAAQEESWRREDNAVQRRVADLKAAGLSPVLAAGSAASSSAPIQMSAPKDETNLGNVGAQAIEKALAMSQMAKTNMDMLVQQAQLGKLESETIGQKIRNGIESIDLELYNRSKKYPRLQTDGLGDFIRWGTSKDGQAFIRKMLDRAPSAIEQITPWRTERTPTRMKGPVPYR